MKKAYEAPQVEVVMYEVSEGISNEDIPTLYSEGDMTTQPSSSVGELT